MKAEFDPSPSRRAVPALAITVALAGTLLLALCALPAGAQVPTGAVTFVFGRASDSVSLDAAVATDGESFRVTGQCLEPLYQYERGSTQPVPALATGCTPNTDGTEWTCALRQGVTFHDGTPFNAAAVVFNFDRWRFSTNPYHFPGQVFEYYAFTWGGFDEASIITSVVAVDEYTVRFTLSMPMAPFLANLAMDPFAISSPAAIQAYGENYGSPVAGCVGTGPFEFVEWVEGDRLTVAANDGYWGGPPAIDAVTWRVIADDAARFLALQAGQILAMEQARVEDLAAAEADPNLYVTTRPALNTAYLAFNFKIREMQDPNFRQAIVHAIDRQGLVADYYGLYGEVATNLLPPVTWGHNDAVVDWPYDPDLAGDYLVAAGFPTGISEVTIDEDVYDSEGHLVYTEGEKIPLRVYYTPIDRPYLPSSMQMGQSIVDDLTAAGLNATLELAGDWPTYLNLRNQGLLMGLYMLGWWGDNGDPDNFTNTFFGYSAEERDPLVAPELWVKNPDPHEGWYANTAVAQLCYQASVNPIQAERQVMYEETEQLLHDDAARLWLAHYSSPLILSKEVGGYIPQAVGTDYYEYVVLGSEWVDVVPEEPASLVYTDPEGSTATVEVPAGAVTETVTLLFQPLADAQPAGGLDGALSFLLEAHVDGVLVSGLTFDAPLTLTINYTDGEIAGLDEATLEVRVWNGVYWSTDGITILEQDPANNQIVVAIAHLSEFAVVGHDADVAHRLYLPLVQRNLATVSGARALPGDR